MDEDAGWGDAEAVARAELALHLRAQNVASRPVLAALESVPRSLFLRMRDKRLAYADRAAPIECGQTISQPTVVAMMTEALSLTPQCRVLEIGTGSGYQTAILSRLCAMVVSLERYRALSDLAGQRLTVLKANNVALHVADGHDGWPQNAPYDRVLITAATHAVPAALVDQVREGGLIVAPIGPTHGDQLLNVYTKSEGTLQVRTLAAVRFVPLLPGVAKAL